MSGIDSCVTCPNGLIDPYMFPARAADLDVAALRSSALTLGSMGETVNDKVGAIDTTWQKLTDCYQSPEQENVYALMKPATAAAGDMRSVFSGMSREVDSYASTLDALKKKLADLEERAMTFKNSVMGGVMVDASDAAKASFKDHLWGAFDWVPGSETPGGTCRPQRTDIGCGRGLRQRHQRPAQTRVCAAH